MDKLKQTFERAWRGVIAPNKYSYNINTVCPREAIIEGHTIERIDFNVPNDDGKNISAVILRQKNTSTKDAILYFHGNGGTKVQIISILPLIAQHKVSVISFDFVGCGNSDNGYLTYGINEASDAQIVLRQAYKYIQVEKLTVWGRSMGAVTAIMFAAKNHKIIQKLILDSPFRNLQQVIQRVIKIQISLPQPLITIVLYFLKKQIQDKLKYPLFQEDYLQHFKRIPKNISVLFISSANDNIVPKSEVQVFYKSFKGVKEILQIYQSHEQDRGLDVYKDVLRFIKRQKGHRNPKLRLYRPTESFSCEQQQITTIC